MLSKFSKYITDILIGKRLMTIEVITCRNVLQKRTLANILDESFCERFTQANSKPCQTSKMELFPQVVTGYRGKFRILPDI